MPRHLLLGLTVVACVLLLVAEFGDLNQIQILTVTKDGVGVGSHHGYALAIIAAVAAVMAFGAWRGSTPAALAVAALGIAALLIVLLVDLPDVDAKGLYGRDYEQVEATAAGGFKMSAAGAVLLLFSGVVTAFMTRVGSARSARTSSRRDAATAGTEEEGSGV